MKTYIHMKFRDYQLQMLMPASERLAVAMTHRPLSEACQEVSVVRPGHPRWVARRRGRPRNRVSARHLLGWPEARSDSPPELARPSPPGGGTGPASRGPVTSGLSVPRQAPTTSLRLHPAAASVPEATGEEYQALKADIARQGVQEPLRALGDVVLDGRHRLRAAQELGLATVPVVDVVLGGGQSEEAYILATALNRRQLSDDQRALMAARWTGTVATTRGRRRDAAGLAFNVSARKVRDALEVDRFAPHLAQEVWGGGLRLSKVLARVRRERQLGLIAATPPLVGTYRTLVVDPPWHYDDADCNGAAENHYATMLDEEVLALPVASHADATSHLYLWTGFPKLEVALAAARAWGFQVRNLLVWEKDRLGLGRTFRSQTEFVVFATRGPALLRRQDLSNLFGAPVTRHSQKPEEFYTLAEEASFEPRLDMFARRERAGWTCWGAEVSAGARAPAIHETGTDIKLIHGGGP